MILTELDLIGSSYLVLQRLQLLERVRMTCDSRWQKQVGRLKY